MAISILVATVKTIDTRPAAALLSGDGGMSQGRMTVTFGHGALAPALKHVAMLEESGSQRSLCSVPFSAWSVLICPVTFGDIL